MNVELGVLKTGAPMIMCDTPLPHKIDRVEYYKDQRLILLVYEANQDEGDMLLTYELSPKGAELLEKSSSILIVDHTPEKMLFGYDVSVVKV